MKINTLLTALMALGLSLAGAGAGAAAAAAAGAPSKIEFWTFSMKPKFTPYFEGWCGSTRPATPASRSNGSTSPGTSSRPSW
ncbi:hypothetical protein [Rugamonas sp. DEMB1]|uniref:hypothetical protein n=1 Tax=Rugamonas sp. DEMB1 TaxID=3039386 RepID=UPI00391D5365